MEPKPKPQPVKPPEPVPQPEPGDKAEYAYVKVHATQGWQSSNLQFSSGDTLSISYHSGTWTGDIDGHKKGHPGGDAPHGPEGPASERVKAPTRYPLPGEDENCLIGRIGGGQPFYIGRQISKPLTESGILFMRMNDEDTGPGLGDNAGAVQMQVRLPRA